MAEDGRLPEQRVDFHRRFVGGQVFRHRAPRKENNTEGDKETPPRKPIRHDTSPNPAKIAWGLYIDILSSLKGRGFLRRSTQQRGGLNRIVWDAMLKKHIACVVLFTLLIIRSCNHGSSTAEHGDKPYLHAGFCGARFRRPSLKQRNNMGRPSGAAGFWRMLERLCWKIIFRF
jgi:hypothetical protein